MNVLRNIVRRKNVKVRTTFSREKIENYLVKSWPYVIGCCGAIGASYGFYESLHDYEFKEDKVAKVCYVTCMSLFMGAIGVIIGFTTPVTLPIAIPAYACLLYQDHKLRKKACARS